LRDVHLINKRIKQEDNIRKQQMNRSIHHAEKRSSN